MEEIHLVISYPCKLIGWISSAAILIISPPHPMNHQRKIIFVLINLHLSLFMPLKLCILSEIKMQKLLHLSMNKLLEGMAETIFEFFLPIYMYLSVCRQSVQTISLILIVYSFDGKSFVNLKCSSLNNLNILYFIIIIDIWKC